MTGGRSAARAAQNAVQANARLRREEAGLWPATALRAPLRRALLVTSMLGATLLSTGCHKRAQVSRRSYPPPPPATRGGSNRDSASRRTTPPLRVPQIDNTVPVGKVETGLASWYAPSGRRSSNGEVYDGNSLTAAHRTLPLETLIRVTNLTTNQSAVVRVTDRGPFVRGRVLDLSTAAAKQIGLYRMGVARVTIQVVQQRANVSPVGRWCVQVGAFLDSANADRLRADLTRQYSASAKVIEFQGATGMWVRINPVQSDRAHATAIAESVRVSEPDAQAYLVRLD